jgi:glucan phosphoethanolaminetransferase (alkaline phosphatase superfamily)
VDRVPEARFQKAPANTHIVVTADHGELFGEAGYFGHGPIMPEQDFEVSFVEGRVP